jgi:dsRNA-specific ribonuclease
MRAIVVANRYCIGRIGAVASALATNANLANVANEIGLVKHIGLLDPRIKERVNEHRLGTIMEALLGAIHEDSGKDIGAVRRAMHQMGLALPLWYTTNLKSYRRKYRSEANQLDLQETEPELDQSDLHKVKSNQDPQLDSPDLQEAEYESSHAVIRKTRSSKRFNMRNIRKNGGLEALHMRLEEAGQGPFEKSDSDQRRLGYEYRASRKQATSDEDFEALDAARARIDDMGADEESSLDHDTEHAVLEDADSKQTQIRDQDADQTGLETSATQQEITKPAAAEFTSSSWRQLVLESAAASSEPETAKRKNRAKLPATDFDSAIGAMMLESDDSPNARGVREWPVRHGWFPQRCEITLDVALSKKPRLTEEVKSYQLDQLLAGPTLDVITLPKLAHTTKELAAYDPDRLRVIVAPPNELDGLIASW